MADYNQTPLSANYYYNRGLVYFELKEYDKAIADYEQVLVLDENNLVTIINIGLLEYEIGEVEVAIEHWHKAIEIDPQSPEPQFALATAFYGQAGKEEAIKLAQNALRLQPAFATEEYLKWNNWGDKLMTDAQKLLLEVQ